MKKYIIWIFILITISSNAQEGQTESVEKFDYKVDGYVIMEKFDRDKKEIIFDKEKFEAGHFRYEIIGKANYKKDKQDFDYVMVKILGFNSKHWKVDPTTKKLRIYRTAEDIEKLKRKKSTKQGDIPHWSDFKDNIGYYSTEVDYREDFIDITDQETIFWMKQEKFDNYVNDGFIKKRYYLTPQVTYGASLTLPFKIRPSIDTLNMKITPELAIGGYLGMRGRLNRYKSIYWYAPVVTAGVTTIGINANNTISEQKIEGTEDGLIFARTFSLGSFVEFNKFQIGIVLGWDKAGGEIGKNWIYNDRLWYSFSIGYNFLRQGEK